jgi:hypothetical protein
LFHLEVGRQDRTLGLTILPALILHDVFYYRNLFCS